MKALSIMQPWAWLIANGHKDIENRSWPTRYRGPVLIHAGKREDEGFDPRDFKSLDSLEHTPWTGDIDADYGGIIGECERYYGATATSEPPRLTPHPRDA